MFDLIFSTERRDIPHLWLPTFAHMLLTPFTLFNPASNWKIQNQFPLLCGQLHRLIVSSILPRPAHLGWIPNRRSNRNYPTLAMAWKITSFHSRMDHAAATVTSLFTEVTKSPTTGHYPSRGKPMTTLLLLLLLVVVLPSPCEQIDDD